MTIRLEEACPKCGSHLMTREGENGDFLACPRFPACKFTKPLPDGDLKIYKKPSPYCEKCNHTGLLPFKNKEGKLIPNTFLHCDCHEINQPEHFDPVRLQPEDFDYPMSDTFRGASFEYCGQPDPGYIPAQDLHEEANTIPEPQWTKEQSYKVQQLLAEINHLRVQWYKHLKEDRDYRANASKRKPKKLK